MSSRFLRIKELCASHDSDIGYLCSLVDDITRRPCEINGICRSCYDGFRIMAQEMKAEGFFLDANTDWNVCQTCRFKRRLGLIGGLDPVDSFDK